MNSISAALAHINPSLAAVHGVPFYIFLIVVFLTLLFILGYLVKGVQVWRQIPSVLQETHALHKTRPSPDPREVGKAFRWEPFKHLWAEYDDTLHELRKAASGENALLASQTDVLVAGLASQVEALLGTVSEQVTKTQRNIDVLGDVSLSARHSTL